MPERSHLSIGEVLSLLREEFPDVTISKIRFLESQGLVDPERTPSGYRKFYEHDVERLRWILRQQREHFLPLKVIKGRLRASTDGDAEAFGSGELPFPYEPPPAAPPARAGAEHQGVPASAPGQGSGAPAGVQGPPAGGPSEQRTGAAVPTGGRPASPGPSPLRPAEAAGSGGTHSAAHPAVASRSAAGGRRRPAQATAPVPIISEPAGVPPTPAARPAPEGGASGRRPGGAGGPGAAPADAAKAAAAGARTGTSVRGGAPTARGAEGGTAGPAGEGSHPGAGNGPRSAGQQQSPPVLRAVPSASGTEAASAPNAGSGRPGSAPAAPGAVGGSGGPGPAGDSFTQEELANACGLEVDQVVALKQFGLISATSVAGTPCFGADALAIAKAAAGLAGFGVEARHLRAWRNAADREASLFEQIVLPLVRQRNPQAREKAQAALDDLSRYGGDLHAALLQRALRDLR